MWEMWETEEYDLTDDTPQPMLSGEEKDWALLAQCLNTFGLVVDETDTIFKNCGPCGRVERSPAYKICKEGEDGKNFFATLDRFRQEKAGEFEEQRKRAAKADFARRGGTWYLEEQEEVPNTQMRFAGDDIFGATY